MTLDRDAAALAILQTLISCDEEGYDKTMPAKAVAIADDLINAIHSADFADQHGQPIIGTGKPSKLVAAAVAGKVDQGLDDAPVWDPNAPAPAAAE